MSMIFIWLVQLLRPRNEKPFLVVLPEEKSHFGVSKNKGYFVLLKLFFSVIFNYVLFYVLKFWRSIELAVLLGCIKTGVF
jgi:hypothetical protein